MDLLLELIQLTSKTPNDTQLGREVRELIRKKLNEGPKDLEGNILKGE